MSDQYALNAAAQARWMAALASGNPSGLREASGWLYTSTTEFRRPTGLDGQTRYIGYDEWAPWMEAIVRAFHPLYGKVLKRLDDGRGTICQLSRLTGVHSGTFELPGIDPVPASGREIVYEELTWMEVADGRITAQFAYFDLASLLHQMRSY